MKILVTTDDGFDAPGFRELMEIAEDLPRAVVAGVAPLTNMSGSGTSRSLARKLNVFQDPRKVWVVDGTPVDCIEWGLKQKLIGKKPFDLVLSGINYGSNTGSITVTCSGTVGAAMAAAARGVPAIALSQSIRMGGTSMLRQLIMPSKVREAIDFCMAHYQARSKTKGLFYNVNLPDKRSGTSRGIKIAAVGSGGYDGNWDQVRDLGYIWHQYWKTDTASKKTDAALLERGYTAVTPMRLHKS